jgi:hypothetical protein
MPVIRGEPPQAVLKPEYRKAITENLRKELSGQSVPEGPVIYEIPLENNRIDVLVVWQAWKSIRASERSAIIMDAFANDTNRIAQALGVTYEEALDQQLLPYAVVPMARSGEADDSELRRLMRAEGAFSLFPGDRLDLRFPSMEMAEAAHRRLTEKMPKGYWSIVQALGQAR